MCVPVSLVCPSLSNLSSRALPTPSVSLLSDTFISQTRRSFINGHSAKGPTIATTASQVTLYRHRANRKLEKKSFIFHPFKTNTESPRPRPIVPPVVWHALIALPASPSDVLTPGPADRSRRSNPALLLSTFPLCQTEGTRWLVSVESFDIRGPTASLSTDSHLQYLDPRRRSR